MSLSDETGKLNPLTRAINTSVEQFLREAFFTLPGRVTAYDPERQLAQVECGIQRVLDDDTGETISVIDDVPVLFPGDDNWHLWHRITPGSTEGLIQFSQRAIDTWIDRGGPVAPHETRMLAPDDACFLPGVRSQVGRIPNMSNEGIGLSNAAQDTRVQLTEDAVTIHRGGGSTVVRLTSGGVGIEHNGVSLGSALGAVTDVIDDTLTQLSTETVVITSGSSSGTYPLAGQAIYTQALTALQDAVSQLETVLGG